MTEDINILTFDNFIQKIKTIKTYRSNANKEYKVVKVNKTALVLRDQRTKADFEVPVNSDNSSRFKPLSLRSSQRRSCMLVAPFRRLHCCRLTGL